MIIKVLLTQLIVILFFLYMLQHRVNTCEKHCCFKHIQHYLTARPGLGSIRINKYLFQANNNILPSSRTEPRINNFAVVYFHSYLLNCIATSLIGLLALSVIPKNTVAHYAQCGHSAIVAYCCMALSLLLAFKMLKF